LAPAIAVCPPVTKLLVSGNRLGDAGTTILCDALRESTVTKVQELDLGSNLIGPEGAKAVAAMAAVVASLTKIS
jgi:Ran GTPase-activating protein (RanGAP) involved in mRNA processing and transport